MRAVSRTFQLEIDETIDRLLAEFNVPIVSLEADARDGWVGVVMDSLGLPKHPPQIDLFSGGAAGA